VAAGVSGVDAFNTKELLLKRRRRRVERGDPARRGGFSAHPMELEESI